VRLRGPVNRYQRVGPAGTRSGKRPIVVKVVASGARPNRYRTGRPILESRPKAEPGEILGMGIVLIHMVVLDTVDVTRVPRRWYRGPAGISEVYRHPIVIPRLRICETDSNGIYTPSGEVGRGIPGDEP